MLAAYAQKAASPSPLAGKLGKVKRGEDDAQIIRARANWFFRQRAYPLPRIPAFARDRAWTVMRQMEQNKRSYFEQKYGAGYRQMAAAAALVANVVNTVNTWQPMGPQPTNDYFFQPVVSGRVSAMVVDPCDATGKTVFLGGAQGGLWLTTNGGTNWTALGDAQPSLAVGSLAVNPNPGSGGCVNGVSRTVYVGTGEENFSLDSYYGAGILTCTTSNGSSFLCARDQTFGNFNAESNPLDYAEGGTYIGSLAVDPANPAIMLAAVEGFESTLPSGIYCSANNGTSWSEVLPGPGTLNIDGTAVAFDQAGYGYATLGNYDGSGGSGSSSLNGVYKSTAKVTTSCSSNFTEQAGLTNLSGVSGSANMGRIAIAVESSPSSLSDPTKDEVFAAIGNAADSSSTLLGVFKSTDGGTTWTQPSSSALVAKNSGFCEQQCFYDLAIAIDPRNNSGTNGTSNVIYAGGAAPGSTNGTGPNATLIASTDGGGSWQDVSANDCNTCLTGLHVDLHAIAFTPATASNDLLYVGTDGGAWVTTNPGSPSSSQSWTDLNQTLALTQFYAGISNDPAGWQYRTFGGAQDNGVQVYGQESGTAWDNTLTCGDGAVTLVDPLLPSTMYAECAYIPGVIGGIVKSLLNGDVSEFNPITPPPSNYSFFENDSGIDFSDTGSFVPPLAIDPNATGSTGDAQTLYFGTYRVWQTTNGGSSWAAISADVSGTKSSDSSVSGICAKYTGYCALTALAAAPTSAHEGEVVTGSNVADLYLSVNANQGTSATWTEVGNLSSPVANDPGKFLPQTNITDVAIDSGGNLYATFSGFSGAYNFCTQYASDGKTCQTSQSVDIPNGHVFYGVVAGGSSPTVAWSDVSSGAACVSPAANLPNIPVNSIVVDPDHAGQLFVGTDVGVFVGELQGAAGAYTGGCWTPLGSGLPNSAVLSLSLNDASRTLLAGTHGRSAWHYALGDQAAFSLGGLLPASAESGATSALTLTLTGTGFTSSSTVNWTPPAPPPSTSLNQVSPPSGCATPTCIAVQVPTNLLASAANVQVSVSDPSQTSSTNSLSFSVTATVPSIDSISTSPSNPTPPLANPMTLTLNGSGFLSDTLPGLAQTAPSTLASSCFSGTSVNSGGTQLTTSVGTSCMQYGGIFYVTATNPPPGGGSSNPSLLAAPAPIGGGCGSSNPPGCLLQLKGTAPSNDSYSAAAAIGANTYTNTEDSSGAPPGNGPAIPTSCTSGAASNGSANAVWYSYTTTTATTLNDADTIGSAYDTILSVWTGSSVSSLTSVACDDDIVSGVQRVSQIQNLNLAASTTYYFMISDYGVPVYNSSGNQTTILGGGGKTVFNFTATPSTASGLTYSSSLSSPNPSSVSAGSSTTTTLTLTAASGSGSGTVTISPCTVSPATTTIGCSYSSSSVTVSTAAATTVTATISTTSRGALPPAAPFEKPPLGWVALALAATALLVFLLGRRLAHTRYGTAALGSSVVAALGFALLAGVLLLQGACGGGSGGGGGGGGGGGTAAGSYTVTIPTSPAASNGNQSVSFTVQ